MTLTFAVWPATSRLLPLFIFTLRRLALLLISPPLRTTCYLPNPFNFFIYLATSHNLIALIWRVPYISSEPRVRRWRAGLLRRTGRRARRVSSEQHKHARARRQENIPFFLLLFCVTLRPA